MGLSGQLSTDVTPYCPQSNPWVLCQCLEYDQGRQYSPRLDQVHHLECLRGRDEGWGDAQTIVSVRNHVGEGPCVGRCEHYTACLANALQARHNFLHAAQVSRLPLPFPHPHNMPPLASSRPPHRRHGPASFTQQPARTSGCSCLQRLPPFFKPLPAPLPHHHF